jgi:5-methylcytosine-specific restriction enzyme subunit McrC
MYQMFAYGQRHLNGVGEMLLIYPKSEYFSKALAVFQFSKDLQLWAVPFDLETGAVVGDGLPDELKPVVGLAPWSGGIN